MRGGNNTGVNNSININIGNGDFRNAAATVG